jgi:hypothetical protein
MKKWKKPYFRLWIVWTQCEAVTQVGLSSSKELLLDDLDMPTHALGKLTVYDLLCQGLLPCF